VQRKATKTTRGPNAEEKAYHGWIKESDYCIACREDGPVICHHCEGSTFKHMKTLIGHYFCIGLCQTCDDVITNGSRKKFRELFGPQSTLWAHPIALYYSKLLPPPEVNRAIHDWGK